MSDHEIDGPKLTWVLGEFTTPEALVSATTKMREQGFVNMDTYSPYPLHGGSEALGLPRSKVPVLAACGAITGIVTAISMMWYMNAFDYPINVGGRPIISGPAYVPITFELAVLLSALSIVFGLLGLSKLPQPYHPVFEEEEFRSASLHSFWISVESDARQTPEAVTKALEALGVNKVSVVKGERE